MVYMHTAQQRVQETGAREPTTNYTYDEAWIHDLVLLYRVKRSWILCFRDTSSDVAWAPQEEKMRVRMVTEEGKRAPDGSVKHCRVQATITAPM